MQSEKKLNRKNTKKKIKTLFLASSYPSRVESIGGIFIKRHAEAVAKECDVYLISVIKDNSLKNGSYEFDFIKENGVFTLRFYYNSKKVFKLFSWIYKFYKYVDYYLKAYKYIVTNYHTPDIIHVNTIFPIGLFAIYLKVTKNIPYIITEHQSYYLPHLTESTYYKSKIRRIITKQVVKYSDMVTTVSEKMKTVMSDIGLKGKYQVVPNVFNKENFFYKPCPVTKKKRILHVSLLGNEKNIEGILRVIKRLKYREDFILSIAGEGENREKLEIIASKYQLSEKFIRFIGKKTEKEIGEIMRKSSFFVLFSKFENFPCVIIEALASGLPVISSNVGGISEYINEKNGILVESENEKALLEAIEFMLENYKLYDKKSIAESAVKNFSYEKVGMKFRNIYESILDY